MDELYNAARIANKELEQTTKKFARETRGKPGLRPKEINNGLKGKERALEKINSDYITINNIPFVESDISKSQATKAIAELMIRVNQSPIMLMGDAELQLNCGFQNVFLHYYDSV